MEYLSAHLANYLTRRDKMYMATGLFLVPVMIYMYMYLSVDGEKFIHWILILYHLQPVISHSKLLFFFSLKLCFFKTALITKTFYWYVVCWAIDERLQMNAVDQDECNGAWSSLVIIFISANQLFLCDSLIS